MTKKYWPTERQKRRQCLAAVILTICAVLDAYVLLRNFDASYVLVEILLVACAVLQWSIYLSIQTQLDIKAILTSQEPDDDGAHNKPNAGDA